MLNYYIIIWTATLAHLRKEKRKLIDLLPIAIDKSTYMDDKMDELKTTINHPIVVVIKYNIIECCTRVHSKVWPFLIARLTSALSRSLPGCLSVAGQIEISTT